jgi:diaminopimelate epimerase
MRIFNADGSEAEMCGNGLRCLVDWMHALGILPTTYTIETKNHLLKAWKNNSSITIEMGSPTQLAWNMQVSFESKDYTVHSLNTGVPHVILFTADIHHPTLEKIGPFIRYHPLWQPQGTNFSLVQPVENQTFLIRTYERGVEAETLACGTGATAAALTVAFQYGLSSPIIMQTKSGTHLEISFKYENQNFTNVTMTGPALPVFNGSIDLKSEF